MPNVVSSGARINFPALEVIWIPKTGNREIFTLYATDEYKEAYYVTTLEPWFKSIGKFKDVDMISYLKRSDSIRLK